MSKSHHLMFMVLGLVLLAGAALRPVTAQVTITDIGTINGRSSAGVGINRAGDVAGFSTFTGLVGDLNGTPSQIFLDHGVLFHDGVLHDLGAIEGRPGCASLGCQSQMFAVNDLGWVVGRSDNGTKGWLPVVWLPEASSGPAATVRIDVGAAFDEQSIYQGYLRWQHRLKRERPTPIPVMPLAPAGSTASRSNGPAA